LRRSDHIDLEPVGSRSFRSSTCDPPTFCRHSSSLGSGRATETATLRVLSDILEAVDCSDDVAALVLLDLSAAFDNVDNDNILSTSAGVLWSGWPFAGVVSVRSAWHVPQTWLTCDAPIAFCTGLDPMYHLLTCRSCTAARFPPGAYVYADDSRSYCIAVLSAKNQNQFVAELDNFDRARKLRIKHIRLDMISGVLITLKRSIYYIILAATTVSATRRHPHYATIPAISAFTS